MFRSSLRAEGFQSSEGESQIYGFSVNEFVLTRSLGFQSVGQVVGVSVLKMGKNPLVYSGSGRELKNLTQLRQLAWENAQSQLLVNARKLNAEIVIGVRGTVQSLQDTGEFHEVAYDPLVPIKVALLGTALRRIDRSKDRKTPVLSALTGQDFYQMVASGGYPRGIVHGHCVYFKRSYGMSFKSSVDQTQWFSKELMAYTRGLGKVRDIAQARMSEQARVLGASGIVYVEINHSVCEIRESGLIISVDMYGEAMNADSNEVDAVVKPVVQLTKARGENRINAR